MKLSLVVLSTGKLEGKVLPINLSQFLIGRDPQCNLRPASAVISKRHCAVMVRDGKVFIRDFDSTNGTFVNDNQVEGECELQNDDVLKVGPLSFRVSIERSVSVDKPTPVPPKKETAASDDEDVAAMLLSLQDDGETVANPDDSSMVPAGSTIMEMMPVDADAPTEEEKAVEQQEENKEAEKKDSNKETTSRAAKAILEKYMRGGR